MHAGDANAIPQDGR